MVRKDIHIFATDRRGERGSIASDFASLPAAKKELKRLNSLPQMKSAGYSNLRIRIDPYVYRTKLTKVFTYIKQKEPTEEEFIKKYGKARTEKWMEQGRIYNSSYSASPRGTIKIM